MSRRPDYNPPSNSHAPPLLRRHSPSMNDQNAAPPPPPPPPPRPAVREDCWPEDATFTLIKAWGDRYLQLNRGNLRQKHWREVADAVNARHAHTKKARRTDIQCKNRIDTLKKKYKLEKSKALELGFENYASSWPFFEPLDSLIGASFKPASPPRRKRLISPPPLPPPPSSVPVAPRSKRPAYNPSADSCNFRRNFSAMAAAAAAIEAAEEDSGTSSGFRRPETEKYKEADSYHELAVAIGRFADVYERVEEAKQRQMVELEKQRMQFTKDLELQRMKLLMESQIQLQKFKGSKRISEPDFYRCNGGDGDADQSGSMS